MSTRPNRWCVLAVLVCWLGTLSACLQRAHVAVPRQTDAVAQYFYARQTWYEPAMHERGDERMRLLRGALDGFAAVSSYFPGDDAITTRSLASYYLGLCHLELGETDRARQDFIHCRDLEQQAVKASASMHAAGLATLRALAAAAHEQMRALDRAGR